jgi:SAM-dependent methyltransferase
VAAEEPTAGPTLARYYDIDLGPEHGDEALYLALAARLGDPVLELAVGSGRLAVPLAAAGHEVTGVDRDGNMLERARKRWQSAQAQGTARGSLALIEADILDLSLDRRFELVILALNSLLLLPGREAQLAALRTIARHLAPPGRAVLDVWLPTAEDLAIYDGRLVLDWVRDDPETGERVAKLSAARHDAATSSALVSTLFDAWPVGGGLPRRVEREDELYFIGPTELVALCGQAGLAVETLGADYSLNEFGPGSERVVLVCSLL